MALSIELMRISLQHWHHHVPCLTFLSSELEIFHDFCNPMIDMIALIVDRYQFFLQLKIKDHLGNQQKQCKRIFLEQKSHF